MSIDDYVTFLETQTGALLPDAARGTIHQWWEGFATTRLYDEITLIELSDDLLLTELLAATGLRGAILHTFSPRLVAIESGAVDAVVADLTARGYTPRIVEGE
jgi:hypothetical protein